MKLIFVSMLYIVFIANINANEDSLRSTSSNDEVAETTIYGRNNGSSVETTTTTHPDGTVVTQTTIKIDCDSWYNEKCYTVSDAPAPNQNHLFFGNDQTPYHTGKLISHIGDTVIFEN